MHPFHVSVTSFNKHFLYSIWYLIRYIFYLLPGITFGILLGFLFDILFCFQLCFLYVVLLFFPSEADGPKLTGCLAVAAGDALTVSHFSDVHFTGPQAGVAVHALAFVQLDGKQRDSVKQAIERAQRTDETAERPEQENRYYDHCRQNSKTVIEKHIRTDTSPRR
jgi:hypothetical protein